MDERAMNVISVIIGIMALILALVGFIPLLGWLNWFVIPAAVVGLVVKPRQNFRYTGGELTRPYLATSA
jgi:hypothetical protein